MKQIIIIAMFAILLTGTELTTEQAEFVRTNRANVNPHPTDANKSIVIAIHEGDTITITAEQIVESVQEKTFDSGRKEADTTFTTKLTADSKEISKIGVVEKVIEPKEAEIRK